MTTLGQSLPRVDARAKVTGEAKYPGDIDMPGQAWMKVLFANRPHARITHLDTTKACKRSRRRRDPYGERCADQ